MDPQQVDDNTPDFAPVEGPDYSAQDTPQPSAQPQPKQDAPPANMIQLTPEQFMAMQQPRQDDRAPAQQSQMTPEQQAEYLRKFNVDDDFVTGFVGALTSDEEGKVDVAKVRGQIEKLRDGLVAQSVRTAELLMQQQLGQVEQRLTPMQEFYQKQQAETVWNEFTKTYPTLGNFRPIVETLAQQMGPSLPPQLSREQKFQMVAQAAAQQISSFQPGFSLQGQHPGSPNSGSPGAPQPTSLSGLGYAPPQGGGGSKKPSNPFYDPILD